MNTEYNTDMYMDEKFWWCYEGLLRIFFLKVVIRDGFISVKDAWTFLKEEDSARIYSRCFSYEKNSIFISKVTADRRDVDVNTCKNPRIIGVCCESCVREMDNRIDPLQNVKKPWIYDGDTVPILPKKECVNNHNPDDMFYYDLPALPTTRIHIEFCHLNVNFLTATRAYWNIQNCMILNKENVFMNSFVNFPLDFKTYKNPRICGFYCKNCLTVPPNKTDFCNYLSTCSRNRPFRFFKNVRIYDGDKNAVPKPSKVCDADEPHPHEPIEFDIQIDFGLR